MHNKSFILSLVLITSFGLLMIKPATAQTIKYRSTIQGSEVVVPDANQMRGARSLKEKIAADGGILLSKQEVVQHLAGNTQQWSNGGAHYQANGRLDFIWEGDLFNDYTWKVRGNGRVCIANPDGFTTSCSLYFKYKGSVWTVVIEEFGVQRDFFGGPDTILVGKKLDDLEPWDPSLSGY